MKTNKMSDQQAVQLAKQLRDIDPSVDSDVRETSATPSGKTSGASHVSDAQAQAIIAALKAEDAKMTKALGLAPSPGTNDHYTSSDPAARLALLGKAK